MPEEDFTRCFTEGFKFKGTLESLERHTDSLRAFEERATATPLEATIAKDMEMDIRKHLEKMAKTNACLSPELKNNIHFQTTALEWDIRKRDWQQVASRLAYLHNLIERW